MDDITKRSEQLAGRAGLDPRQRDRPARSDMQHQPRGLAGQPRRRRRRHRSWKTVGDGCEPRDEALAGQVDP